MAELYPEHEFLFLTDADALAILSKDHNVCEIPTPATPTFNHRIIFSKFLVATLKFNLERGKYKRRVLEIIDDFKPDAAGSDYEYFVPRVSRERSIPCLSIDHQHIITTVKHRLPFFARLNYIMTSQAVNGMFTCADKYIVVSFFEQMMKKGIENRVVVPPIFRKEVFCHTSEDQGHIVAYQGYSTFSGFIPFLQKTGRKVKVYGLNRKGSMGNIEFKEDSVSGVLNDLATCSYVVCGGGHTLISEALYYGKPIISFPLLYTFEQYLNAYYLEKLGYGIKASIFGASQYLIDIFEENFERYRENIRKVNFLGNDKMRIYFDAFLEGRAFEDVK
jgi:uncharacterized protein (TIGR00661 family)